MKAAVYCGTRNLYSDMITAAKSLAINSSVDKIYFVIEDSVFPYELPDYVECISVENQTYFDIPGPNVKKLWSYMTLIRTVLTKLLPDLDKVLSLDVDTIIDQNIDELWDIPIDDYYGAAVAEPVKSKPGFPYVNVGVIMYNLKKLREDKVDDKLIKTLNTKRYEFADQDCINELCRGKLLTIPYDYNSTQWTGISDNPKVIHFAAESYNVWTKYPIVKKYRDIPWAQIRMNPIRYMIHACPERTWYVNGILIPSMLEEGISRSDIFVWNDINRRGNLFACMDCFQWCGENPTVGGTWHIQDDVVISRKFSKITHQYNDGVVCGCVIKDWGPDPTKYGTVPVKELWYSFQCIRIPDEMARECAKWFYEDASLRKSSEFQMRIRRNKHDDDFFRYFLLEKYPKLKIRNLNPCIVDHIDYMVGGSLINRERGKDINRAVYWEEESLITELENKLREMFP